MVCSPIRGQLLVVVLTLGVFLPPSAVLTFAADACDRFADLDGTWKLVSVESEGEARQLDEDVRWLIKETKVLYGGEPLATLASYRESTPKGIDLAFDAPKKEHEGIYTVDKDELRICLNIRTLGPKERPIDLSTKDKPDVRILTFRRISPADEGPQRKKGFIGIALSAENGGVVIGSVLQNSPAERAGLLAGDVVLRIGDQKVGDLQTAVDKVRRETPGRELKVHVRREGKERVFAVKVAVFPFSLLGLLD